MIEDYLFKVFLVKDHFFDVLCLGIKESRDQNITKIMKKI